MKRNHGYKELDQLQTLKRENEKLKRQISSLRKQLARIDLDRYVHVKSIVEDHLAGQEVEQSTQSMLESMKNTWKCHSCSDGHMEIETYSKAGNLWYYRSCSNKCGNRTTGKPYDPNSVKGILAIHDAEPEKPDKTRKTFKK